MKNRPVIIFITVLFAAAALAVVLCVFRGTDTPVRQGAAGVSEGKPYEPDGNEAAVPSEDAPSEPTAEPPEPEPPEPMPEGFTNITDAVPDAVLEMRYYSDYNFVGARVDGYEAPVGILSAKAAEALGRAADGLRAKGYIIKIYDAYRPQRAVDHFARWAEDTRDVKTKAAFYPDIDKSSLFPLGYIARKSAHTRGGAVDITIVNAETGEEADMGSPFDFFGGISGHGTSLITQAQADNRELLRKAMEANGFKKASGEWWHYSLAEEAFPDTYFDFPVKFYTSASTDLLVDR